MKYKLFSLIILIVFLVGCATQQTVCNKPYILVGNDCCLDKNDNSICDSDESEESKEQKPICNRPYIQVGGSCCLDKNDNKICDKDETIKEEQEEGKCGDGICDAEEDCETCQKDCSKCFSLSDLQADVNKLIDWKTVLKKEKEEGVANYYVHSELRARLLGKYPSDAGYRPSKTYYKVLPKRYLLVTQIKDKENYIKDSNEFYQYIVDNKDYILAPITEAKNNFQKEFKGGEVLELMFENQANKYEFINMSDDEKVFFDNITLMETVGDKIIETTFVSTDDYELTYRKEGINNKTIKKIIKFSGVNYGQIISVFCSPSLIITLYPQDSYDKQDYDRSDISSSYFFNDIRYDRKSVLVDATALVGMCEQRYEFTYLRYR